MFWWISTDKNNLAVFDVKTIIEEENDNKTMLHNTNMNDEWGKVFSIFEGDRD